MKKMTVLLVFAGIAMMGQGGRMLYQGIFQPGSYYSPVLFDLFFDWGSLFLMGAVVFGWSLSKFYESRKNPA